VCGTKAGVNKAKSLFKGQFDCDDVGELKEYIGCKVEIVDSTKQYMKLTQPVLLQSYADEFDIPSGEVPKPLQYLAMFYNRVKRRIKLPFPIRDCFAKAWGNFYT
jgi:hypothetical protein